MSEKDKPRIQWSATAIVGIGIDNPERVRKTEDGKTVLMPTTFPAEDDPGWFEADVWDCPVCVVKKIAEDCPECPGCFASQPKGAVYRGRCWGFTLPENPKVSLADLPRREPKEEVCGHCGATYTGLFHCQSIKNIREIEEDFAPLWRELLPSKREVVPITPLDGLMVEGRVLKVVREVQVVESTPHGPEGQPFYDAYLKGISEEVSDE